MTFEKWFGLHKRARETWLQRAGSEGAGRQEWCVANVVKRRPDKTHVFRYLHGGLHAARGRRCLNGLRSIGSWVTGILQLFERLLTEDRRKAERMKMPGGQSGRRRLPWYDADT